jgi:uncharacterized protein YceH (UPF0502 family)
VALLAVLLLRGPQTAAELRTGTERMHKFADVSAVEAFLDELAARDLEAGGPLVVKLARAPGERESRWAQLLAGPVEARRSEPTAAEAPVDLSLADLAALRAQHNQLVAEVADLRAKMQRMASELGIAL